MSSPAHEAKGSEGPEKLEKALAKHDRRNDLEDAPDQGEGTKLFSRKQLLKLVAEEGPQALKQLLKKQKNRQRS